jgi:NAD(P)-dependent dehydrogenase (short-subunit alcohol dehydrogenase family)
MTGAQKIALVTGASRGLGKNMAISLAGKGIDVILTYRTNEEEASKVAANIQSMGRKAAVLSLDMSHPDTLDQFINSLKGVLQSVWQTNTFDFLVNNAGMGATIPFEQVIEDQFDEFMNVHFKGVYFLTQKCVPLINPGGRIINISSGTTRFSNPGYSIYASMKGAIEVFTRYLAKELGSKGIAANVVAPGPIETDFNSAAIRNNPNLKGMLSSLTPLGRVGRAEDIGGVVAFLCSEEARWINGQRIEVSGGINS